MPQVVAGAVVIVAAQVARLALKRSGFGSASFALLAGLFGQLVNTVRILYCTVLYRTV
jgi:hypothetical protein